METNFHVACYSGSVGAGLLNVDTPAVQDGQLTIANNHFVLPRQAQFLWAYPVGVGLSRARLNTPKMRYVGLPSIVPVNVGTSVASPPNVVDWTADNIMLDTIDEVAVECSSSDAGAQTMKVLVAFGFGMRPVPAQPVFRIRGTASITASTTAWTNGSITLDQTLPRGTYDVVGLDAVGTNLLAARMVFSGYGFRPGCLARNSASSLQHPLFTNGKLGVFGTFDSINLPTIDVIALGANTSQEIFLDLVRRQGSMATSA